MGERSFSRGEIVCHILSEEKFVVIDTIGRDIYEKYKCRSKDYKVEEFYEFEIKKVEK